MWTGTHSTRVHGVPPFVCVLFSSFLAYDVALCLWSHGGMQHAART